MVSAFFQSLKVAPCLGVLLILVMVSCGADDKPKCKEGYEHHRGQCIAIESASATPRKIPSDSKKSPKIKSPQSPSAESKIPPGDPPLTQKPKPRNNPDPSPPQKRPSPVSTPASPGTPTPVPPYLSYSRDDKVLTVSTPVASFEAALGSKLSYGEVSFEFRGGWQVKGQGASQRVMTRIFVDAEGTEAAGHGGVNVYDCQAQVAQHVISGVKLSVSDTDKLLLTLPEDALSQEHRSDFLEIFALGSYKASKVREPRVKYKKRNLKTTTEQPCRRYLYKNQVGSDYDGVTVVVLGATHADTVGAGAPVGDEIVKNKVKLYPSKDKNLVSPSLDIYVGSGVSKTKVASVDGGGLKYLLEFLEPDYVSYIKVASHKKEFQQAVTQLVAEVIKRLKNSSL